jgi:hypothetical protein
MSDLRRGLLAAALVGESLLTDHRGSTHKLDQYDASTIAEILLRRHPGLSLDGPATSDSRTAEDLARSVTDKHPTRFGPASTYSYPLSDSNRARQKEWMGKSFEEMNIYELRWCCKLLFRAVEMAGEAGEALNVVKKLVREKMGAVGSRATMTDLGKELSDVVITADLMTVDTDIDLFGAAVPAKFNETSEKYNLTTRFGAHSESLPPDIYSYLAACLGVSRQKAKDSALRGNIEVRLRRPE